MCDLIVMCPKRRRSWAPRYVLGLTLFVLRFAVKALLTRRNNNKGARFRGFFLCGQPNPNKFWVPYGMSVDWWIVLWFQRLLRKGKNVEPWRQRGPLLSPKRQRKKEKRKRKYSLVTWLKVVQGRRFLKKVGVLYVWSLFDFELHVG